MYYPCFLSAVLQHLKTVEHWLVPTCHLNPAGSESERGSTRCQWARHQLSLHTRFDSEPFIQPIVQPNWAQYRRPAHIQTGYASLCRTPDKAASNSRVLQTFSVLLCLQSHSRLQLLCSGYWMCCNTSNFMIYRGLKALCSDNLSGFSDFVWYFNNQVFQFQTQFTPHQEGS